MKNKSKNKRFCSLILKGSGWGSKQAAKHFDRSDQSIRLSVMTFECAMRRYINSC